MKKISAQSMANSSRSKSVPIRPRALLLLLLLPLSQLLATNPIGTQASSASYLDDYFSAAKYAVNKLQQSLGGAGGAASASSAPTSQPPTLAAMQPDTQPPISELRSAPEATPAASVPEAPPTTEAAAPSSSSAEPDRDDGFVRVGSNLAKDELAEASSEAPTTTTKSTTTERQQDLASSSAPASDETTTIVVNALPELTRTTDDDGRRGEGARDPPEVAVDSLAASQMRDEQPSLLEPAAGNSLVPNSSPSTEDDSAPTAPTILRAVEETIKETEMNAVAAVEASIGFANDLNQLVAGNEKEPCYDEYGNPRFCEPEFENVAFERQVEASSECGQPASRFCTTSSSTSVATQSASAPGNGQVSESQTIRNCHICDAQHPKKRHPASFLTDLNSAQNPTCWVSAPIAAAASTNSSADTSSQDSLEPIKGDNVTLVLNLGKRYEILYVSLQFCSLKPDSLSIWKSNDFGASWQPYQFYSSHCARLYGRQQQASASSQPGMPATKQMPGEASCTNVSSSGGSSATRVAFSTLDGARVGLSLDKSAQLQDWLSATNIKVTLDRHQAAWIQSTLALHSWRSSSSPTMSTGNSTTPPPASSSSSAAAPAASLAAAAAAAAEASSAESSLTNPSSNTFNYAISDLAIGGRCKCNGHASRCIHDKEGQLQCDCRHNTAGRDCEKCAPLHADRPWARATPTEANICQACNCNGHSRKCVFDPDLYRLSGKRSGGVCQQCKHNTGGRHCHYCVEGYTRDHSRPMSDKNACKECECHRLGSLGRVCNQTTGQCPCKEGVTGLLCNRCAPGYQQSTSPSEPCIMVPGAADNRIDGDASSSSQQQQQQQPELAAGSGQSGPAAAGADDEQPSVDEGAAAADTTSGAAGRMEPQASLAAEQLAAAGRAPPGGQDQRHQWSGGQPANQPDEDAAGSWPLQPMDNNRNDLLAGSLDERDFYQPTPKANSAYLAWQHRQQTTGGPGRKASSARKGYPHMGAHEPHRYRKPPSSDYEAQLDGSSPEDLYELPQAANYDPSDGYAQSGGQRHYSQRKNYYRQQQQQDYWQQAPPLRPVVSLDPGDDYLSGEQYGGGQLAASHGGAALFGDEFNQIRRAPHRRQHHKSPMQQQQPYSRTSSQSSRRVGFEQTAVAPPNATPFANNNNNKIVHSNVNNNIIVDEAAQCGDCQANQPVGSLGARRSSPKKSQFCQLEYAIKCSVLNQLVAEDWTKFDVEIQDIFKSPTAAAGRLVAQQTLSQQPATATNFMALMQNDAPVALPEPSQSLAANKTASASGTSSSSTSNNDIASHQHRLKVGTVQSIWVPTEDLACRCPHLKRGATYLLMGTIDARENSANSLQLDRHGVALEWQPSLQKKMMLLQRKYARGKICA